MPNWLLELLKAILSGGVMTVTWEIVRNFRRKSRESAEVAKIYKEGDELNISIRTNIDKYVEEKSKIYLSQVNELEKTIVQISSKYRNDLERYLQRIADLEKKFDEQQERAQLVETELNKERDARFNCSEQLRNLQTRLTSLEKSNETNTPKT